MNESDDVEIDLSRRERLAAVARVARFDPVLVATIVGLSLLGAALEGIGVGFLVPIIEQVGGSGREAGGLVGDLFARLYATLGIPYTLGTIVGGVAFVITVRHALNVVLGWLEATLRTRYMRSLKCTAFEGALDARTSYFDTHGSEELLNTIVTESKYASRVIRDLTGGAKQLLVAATYAAIAVFLAPVLTLAAILVLGGLVYLVRELFESALSVGSRIAAVNERLQRIVGSTTRGIREIKLYGLRDEVAGEFRDAIDEHTRLKIRLRTNRTAFDQSYSLVASLAVFALIFLAVNYASLSLGALGMYLFTMFRLAPMVSSLNKTVYKLDENVPHLVRTERFVETVAGYERPDSGGDPAPTSVDRLSFRDVSFRYDGSPDARSDGGVVTTADDPETDDPVLADVSFDVSAGETVAFVGPSGAGKSTIASVVARLYDPDAGTVTANGRPIREFALDDWRSRVAVVQQDPFVFDRSLRDNVAIADRTASDTALQRACERAAVTEFLDELPDGYDTQLGEDGVRLSGGQRQRVAVARALLADPDVLVLDEATSDLDRNLEAQVHAGVGTDHDRLLLVIAHRLSTVVDADRIYYVENGRIEESGTHEELLARDGRYAALYEE